MFSADTKTIRDFPIAIDARDREVSPNANRFRHTVATALYFEWFTAEERRSSVVLVRRAVTAAGPLLAKTEQLIDVRDNKKFGYNRPRVGMYTRTPEKSFVEAMKAVQALSVSNGFRWSGDDEELKLYYAPVDTPIFITLNSTDKERIEKDDKGTMKYLSKMGANMYEQLYSQIDPNLHKLTTSETNVEIEPAPGSILHDLIRPSEHDIFTGLNYSQVVAQFLEVTK